MDRKVVEIDKIMKHNSIYMKSIIFQIQPDLITLDPTEILRIGRFKEENSEQAPVKVLFESNVLLFS